MRFKHKHAEKPRIDFHAMPTPTWDTFETVHLSVGIHGTTTHIGIDMPAEKAREWAAEIIAACEVVEAECG